MAKKNLEHLITQIARDARASALALQNVPPKSGTEWRANFYRMDYDDGKPTRWTWVPVGPSFHEYQKFGRLVFE